MISLTNYELSLVPRVLDILRAALAKGKEPHGDTIRRKIMCGQDCLNRVRQYIDEKGLLTLAPGQQLEQEIAEDTWIIKVAPTNIHTLEQLLDYCKVDLDLWEVERFIVNKWEMGYIAGSTAVETPADAEHSQKKTTDKTYEASSRPLYQVKASLRRRKFTDLEHATRENARLLAQVEKLKLTSSANAGMARHLARNHAGYDDIIANVKEFAQALGDFQLPKTHIDAATAQRVPAVSPNHTEDAVMMLSDEHYGDVIRREDTSGFPEYDLVIAGNRTGFTIHTAKQILSLHRAMYPIKRMYVWMGGDVGNGVLHDSPNSNALFPPAQVHFGYHMLKFAIEDLLTLTKPDEHGVKVIEEIVLLFTVGNHMRMDEKMPHKYQAQRTLDWLIYQFLIERFARHPKVLIRQEMSPFIFESIRGHRHMFAHGMQVGFRNSPDAQNKAIAKYLSDARALFDSPEWRKVNNLEGETFSRACIGDIHIPLCYPRFISNGSLNGQNELGVNWALEPIPAVQQLWGVSKSHQQTWHYEVESTKIQRSTEDMNSYGTFAAEYMQRIGRGGTGG